jgi:hypothetical protein
VGWLHRLLVRFAVCFFSVDWVPRRVDGVSARDGWSVSWTACMMRVVAILTWIPCPMCCVPRADYWKNKAKATYTSATLNSGETSHRLRAAKSECNAAVQESPL